MRKQGEMCLSQAYILIGKKKLKKGSFILVYHDFTGRAWVREKKSELDCCPKDSVLMWHPEECRKTLHDGAERGRGRLSEQAETFCYLKERVTVAGIKRYEQLLSPCSPVYLFCTECERESVCISFLYPAFISCRGKWINFAWVESASGMEWGLWWPSLNWSGYYSAGSHLLFQLVLVPGKRKLENWGQ